MPDSSRRLDLPLLLGTCTLCILGLVMIYSATARASGPGSEVARQGVMMGLGWCCLVLFSLIDHELWRRVTWPLYGACLALLGAVMIVGTQANGAQRWLSLGPLGTIQPSEPTKLLLILVLARLLADGLEASEEPRVRRLGWIALVLAPPLGLVLLQPDLGTTLAIAGTSGLMLYGGGIPPGWLMGGVSLGLAAAPFCLHDYQKERLLVFMNPEVDPTGSGWNLIQARIAIGSGGIWGQGLFQGTQNNLRFVPEHHTDFIFTVVGEELGLVGALAVLILFAYLVAHGLRVAAMSRDPFASMVSLGISGMFAVHVLVNVGMTLGLTPVTGLPLPFLSFGGSALVTNLSALGILNNIWLRRPRWPGP